MVFHLQTHTFKTLKFFLEERIEVFYVLPNFRRTGFPANKLKGNTVTFEL